MSGLNRPVVTELVKSCEHCPAQWDGRTEDGRVLYVRYRYGRLSVQLGVDTGDEFDGVNGALILQDAAGDQWDGSMETAEMILRTDHVLDFSRCVLQSRGGSHER
jgi:hypothetical protein